MNRNILSRIFPEFVITEETNLEPHAETIYPEEEIFIQNAARKRKVDFTVGRICARKALARLCIDNFPIKMANDRTPLWPDGIVGSISHTQGYCGVAVALKKDAKSLGLDMECINRLNDKCWPFVCTESEISQIKSLPKEKQKNMAALTFSAKECFYKCQYTINKKWVGFHDAAIYANPDINEGEFEIRLLKDIAPGFLKGNSFNGKYTFKDKFVFSGMTLIMSLP